MGLSPGLTVWECSGYLCIRNRILYSRLFSDSPRVGTSGMVMDLPAVMAAWAVQASSAAGLQLASSDRRPLTMAMC